MIGRTISHFTIEAKLGAGGMGVVYLAEDSELRRKVALKILPEEMAGDPRRLERFQREAQALAALNHPNIVTIFSVEHVTSPESGAPVHFIAMELVEGQSLDRLLAEQSLEPARILDLGIAVADGLAAAHARGITHRDLKPGNVMLSDDGTVKILDFGLARTPGLPALESDRTEALTQEGSIVGTVHYMSPEQAQGRPAGPESDVFSLGVLLYEAAIGRRPFRGDSTAALISAILRDRPQPELADSVIPGLGGVLRKCLQKEPGARYRSAIGLRDALRGLPAETAGSPRSGEIRGVARSIAVLPFRNLAGTSGDDYFCEGLAEELIDALAKVKRLHVAARSSSFRFTGRDPDLDAVQRELGVGAVLEGSVRRAGERLRISVRLVDLGSRETIWSEQFDGSMADIFEIQDRTAEGVVDRLRLELGEGVQPIQRTTESREAHNLYLRGRYYWNRRHAGGLQQSRECFLEAADLDPHYALAHVGVADAEWSLAAYMLDPGALSRARAALASALAIEPDLPAGLASLSSIEIVSGNWEAAEAAYRRTVALNPDNALAHAYWSLGLSNIGRFAEMRECIAKAVEAEPFNQGIHGMVGIANYLACDFTAALGCARRGLELDSDSFVCTYLLGLACAEVGDYAAACSSMDRAVELSAGSIPASSWQAYVYARAGKKNLAESMLTEIELRGSSEFVHPYYLGFVHLGLGHRDVAYEHYLRTFAEGGVHLLAFGGRPFPDLLERAGALAEGT
jgi:TolB-like protein/Flp pilus assembly protein TadD